MAKAVKKISIKGFKSIKEIVNLELNNLNILIGSNGVGKSNLICFFKILRALIDDNLNSYINQIGGASDLLFNGRKFTTEIEFELLFDIYGYKFKLVPTAKDGVSLEQEARYDKSNNLWLELGDSANGSSLMVDKAQQQSQDDYKSQKIYDAIKSWQIYHFHDTSATAAMRHYAIIQDNQYLRTDAANIGAFLLHIKSQYQDEYQKIINAIRLVIPFFDDFILKIRKSGMKEDVNLSWKQKGSDFPMQPYHLSDGSIRFICLATALLQPNLPTTIIIDEPELGLHPGAIIVLAELIQQASQKTQIIVATQSVTFLDQFSVNDILVVNRQDGASTFERLQEQDYKHWLKEYSLGELWQKNIIAGALSND
jgi:predicted ATPase